MQIQTHCKTSYWHRWSGAQIYSLQLWSTSATAVWSSIMLNNQSSFCVLKGTVDMWRRKNIFYLGLTMACFWIENTNVVDELCREKLESLAKCRGVLNTIQQRSRFGLDLCNVPQIIYVIEHRWYFFILSQYEDWRDLIRYMCLWQIRQMSWKNKQTKEIKHQKNGDKCKAFENETNIDCLSIAWESQVWSQKKSQ